MNKTRKVVFISAAAMAGAVFAAPTVNYVGCEFTTGGTGNNWGLSPGEGWKGAYRDPSTDPKAFVIRQGAPNAYGLDGYIAFAVNGVDGGGAAPGVVREQIFTGTLTDDPVPFTFHNPAPWLEMVAPLGPQGSQGSPGGWNIVKGSGDVMSNPALGLMTGTATRIRQGAFYWYWDKNLDDTVNGVPQTTNVLKCVLGDAMAGSPNQTNRLGICTSRAINDGRARRVSVNGVWGNENHVVTNSEKPNWHFFDVSGWTPGDELFIGVEQWEPGMAHTTITVLTFDSTEEYYAPPVIDAISATPSTAAINPATGFAEVTLSVEASDVDGDVLSYQWQKVSGADGVVLFDTPKADETTVLIGKPGSYTFSAAVTDGMLGPVTSNVTVTVTGDMIVQVDYAGKETSSVDYPAFNVFNAADWGSTPTTGNKRDFRKTNTVEKAFVLPGNPNAYGVDGYVFPAPNAYVPNPDANATPNYILLDPSPNAPFGSIHSGSTMADYGNDGLEFFDVTPYISSVELLGPYGWNMPANYNFGLNAGGPQWEYGLNHLMDDPRSGIGDETTVTNIYVQTVWSHNADTGKSVPRLKITFNKNARKVETLRIGIRSDRGDSQKPDFIMVGNVEVATDEGKSNYRRPSWYFFDVTGMQGGQDIIIGFREGDGYGYDNSVRCNFQGLVFDSTMKKGRGGSLFFLQ